MNHPLLSLTIVIMLCISFIGLLYSLTKLKKIYFTQHTRGLFFSNLLTLFLIILYANSFWYVHPVLGELASVSIRNMLLYSVAWWMRNGAIFSTYHATILDKVTHIVLVSIYTIVVSFRLWFYMGISVVDADIYFNDYSIQYILFALMCMIPISLSIVVAKYIIQQDQVEQSIYYINFVGFIILWCAIVLCTISRLMLAPEWVYQSIDFR